MADDTLISAEMLQQLRTRAEQVLQKEEPSFFDKRQAFGQFLLSDMLLEKPADVQQQILRGLAYTADPAQYKCSEEDKRQTQNAMKASIAALEEQFPEEGIDRSKRRSLRILGGAATGAIGGVLRHRSTAEEGESSLSRRELQHGAVGAAIGGAMATALGRPVERVTMNQLTDAALKLYHVQGQDRSLER